MTDSAQSKEREWRVFDHDSAYYTRGRRFIRGVVLPVGAWLTRVSIEVHNREHIPASGPALIIMNHSGGLDPLTLMLIIRPRFLNTMSKVENYKIPLFGALMGLWGAYPVTRGAVDRRALDYTLKLLARGEIALIAPEGTRQPTMIEAKDGLTFLAIKAGVPIVPVGLAGTRDYFSNLKRLRRTRIVARFGPAFRFRTNGRSRVPRDEMAQMTREAMYQLAKLVPPEKRGFYSDIMQATTDTLDFI